LAITFIKAFTVQGVQSFSDRPEGSKSRSSSLDATLRAILDGGGDLSILITAFHRCGKAPAVGGERSAVLNSSVLAPHQSRPRITLRVLLFSEVIVPFMRRGREWIEILVAIVSDKATSIRSADEPMIFRLFQIASSIREHRSIAR
jgi:hypothetical protein